MSLAERILFNVLFNSIFSFFAGLSIVLVAIKVLKVGDGGLKIYLLSLPFVKIVADIFRGIPPDSYVWSSLDVLALPQNIGRWLAVDVDFAKLGPTLSVKLSIGNAATKIHSFSIADMAYAWIVKLSNGHRFVAALWLCVLIAGLLATRRVARWVQFEHRRQQDRNSSDSLTIDSLAFGFRTIDIYQSPSYTGTPFTGGFLKPYICFPTPTLKTLSPEERHAVTQHELAHVKQWDLVQTLAMRLLGDLFWFVPFYRIVSRQIDAARELMADQVAVRMGAKPLLLATALIKIGEAVVSPPDSALYSAFLKRPSLTARRVKTLTEIPAGIPVQQSSRRFSALRVVAIAWVSGAVFSMTLGGNYQIEEPSEPAKYVSGLIHRWLDLHSTR